MCEKCRVDCIDCQKLVEKYGECNLNICNRCGHFLKKGDKCSCSDIDERCWEEN